MWLSFFEWCQRCSVTWQWGVWSLLRTSRTFLRSGSDLFGSTFWRLRPYMNNCLACSLVFAIWFNVLVLGLWQPGKNRSVIKLKFMSPDY
jgi:hypothetical protein